MKAASFFTLANADVLFQDGVRCLREYISMEIWRMIFAANLIGQLKGTISR
jgi:hypothetical protein